MRQILSQGYEREGLYVAVVDFGTTVGELWVEWDGSAWAVTYRSGDEIMDLDTVASVKDAMWKLVDGQYD